jgi:hypothetical protein
MRSHAQSQIDTLIEQFFSAFDNRGGNRPGIADLDCLFTQKAVIVHSQEEGVVISSLQEFAQPRIELLNSGKLIDFHEWETTSETKIFDSLATRVSTYEKNGLLNGDPYSGGGTKLFNLVIIDSEWRIASLSWLDSNES